jgi:hypothetical protein
MAIFHIECLRCETELTVIDDAPPGPSKITVCGACGHVMLINDDMAPEELPEEVRETIENSPKVIDLRSRMVH